VHHHDAGEHAHVEHHHDEAVEEAPVEEQFVVVADEV
jgi:hypothetical protein